jgi:hypothetical protein
MSHQESHQSHSHNHGDCQGHDHEHGHGHGHGPSQSRRPKTNTIYGKLKSYCINNQLPRFISNIIVIWIIGSGTYLDTVYFSYSIKNKYDRAYQSMYMLVMFLWAALIYLKTSHKESKQTKVEEFSLNNDTYAAPIININNKKFNKECEICSQKKFYRSSHCRMCGFCVLRRDHHCPGLGMCVGYHNTQNFVNLLIVMIVSIFKLNLINISSAFFIKLFVEFDEFL